MDLPASLSLENIVTAVYCALDDALIQADCGCRNGKLVWRPGPEPKFDDREALCVAVLQELLDFESDTSYFDWLAVNSLMRQLFPHLPSRQKFADRRALLTPLLQRLSQAFCELGGEGQPPFSSLIPTPCSSASSSALATSNGSAVWRRLGTAQRSRRTSTASANI